MKNPIVRTLLILAMVIALVLILWFPMHTIPNVIGYLLISLGILTVLITTKKEKKK